MTRIAVKHGKPNLSKLAIFLFFLPILLFITCLNEVTGCDPVRQKVGGRDFGCLFDSGYLSLEQQAFAPQNSILPNANEIADNRSSGILSRIGARITCGIVESRKAWDCMACFGNTIVDLPALVATDIDQQLTTDDTYWKYYTHCDRWQVTFNNQLIIPRATDWAQDVIQRCRQTYLLLEFVAIENLPNGRLVSGRLVTGDSHFQEASFDRTVLQRNLTSWLSELSDQLLDQLKTASARLEPAEVSSQ